MTKYLRNKILNKVDENVKENIKQLDLKFTNKISNLPTSIDLQKIDENVNMLRAELNATDKGISSYKVTEIFRKIRRSYDNLKDEVASNKNSITFNQESISNLNSQIMNCCEKLDKLFDPIKFKIDIMSTIAKLDDKINTCVIKFQEDKLDKEQKMK